MRGPSFYIEPPAFGECQTGPVRKDRYEWICDMGCGACEPTLVQFRIFHSVNTDTGATNDERSVPMLVSSCCGKEMSLWDKDTEDVVEGYKGRLVNEQPTPDEDAE